VLKPTVPITVQQTTDCLATKDRHTSNAGSRRSTPPPALKIDTQQPTFLASTSFTSAASPNACAGSLPLRSVRVEHRPPTPPLRPLKPLPLRPVTRKPPPAIPVELLPQTPKEVSTVAFPSSISSPIPLIWSTMDSWCLPPPSSSPSPSFQHRTPSSRIMSKLEPVIECPLIESKGRSPSPSSTKESRSRQRRSTSLEGARRRPVEFLGLNKSTPDLRLGTNIINERVGKGRHSPRARILSLGLLRRARTGSKPKLSISSPLSTTESPSGLSTIFTSSLPQESSPSTPSPTTPKCSSPSFRRWTNFVAKLFEPSSSSRPSSPSIITSSYRSSPPTNTNTNAPLSAWIAVPAVPPSFGKPNKRRLLHGRSFSHGTNSSLRRKADEAGVSGFCLPAGVDPGRRPSLP